MRTAAVVVARRSFYLAYDHNDEIYESAEWRRKVEDEFHRLVAEEDGKRGHPEGYKPYPVTVDGSRLLVSLHWVHCDYAGKPGWAHSDAIVAGFREGGDYAFRTNDDTTFPAQPDWADRFIRDLRDRDMPNVGVVGPSCEGGPQAILTHDFVHRTHALIFGFHYPRSLPGWSSDDWISYVYEFVGLRSKRTDVTVVHRMHGQRYRELGQAERLQALNRELELGVARLDEFTKAQFGKVQPHNVHQIMCC